MNRQEIIEAVTHYAELHPKLTVVMVTIEGERDLLERVGDNSGVMDEVRCAIKQQLNQIIPNAIESGVWFYGINTLVAAWNNLHDNHSEELVLNCLKRAFTNSHYVAGRTYHFKIINAVSFHPDQSCTVERLLATLELKTVLNRYTGTLFNIGFDNNGLDPNKKRKLEIGLINSELRYEFSPILNLATNRIEMLSAALFWYHPEQGKVSGEGVLSEIKDSAYLLNAWKRTLPGLFNDIRLLRLRNSTIKIIIPVPMGIFMSNSFTHELSSLLAEYSLTAHDLSLALTNCERLSSLYSVNGKVEIAIKMGFDIHLRGVGGSLNIDSLRDIKCTHVTTCPSLARTISDTISQDYLEFLIRTLRRKNIMLICDGVVSNEIKTELQAFGIKLAQGGVFGEYDHLTTIFAGAA